MEKIKTFLSSAMTGELYAERVSLKVAFRSDERVRHFYELYAIDDHASPNQIEKAYSEEVASSKVFVLVLGTELRRAVAQEFDVAKGKSLNIFCYIKNGVEQATDMKEFIGTEAYQFHCGYFYTPEELATKVVDDLTDDLTRKYLKEIVSPVLTGGGQYGTFTTSTPSSEYRFHSVNYLLEMSQKAEVTKLSREQLISLAITYEEQYGDYKTALLLLEIGLLRWPDDWLLHNNRGIILDTMGLKEGALYSYRKVLDFKPDSDTALYNVANIFMDQGRYTEAIQYYHKCLLIKPEKVDALNRLAVCHLRKGDIDNALKWSNMAILQAEDDEVVLTNHVLILSAMGLREEALLESEKLKSNTHYYHLVRAYILFDAKRYEEALKHIEAILDLGALDYELAVKKFYCLSALNNIDEARKWIEKVDKNYPVHADDYNNVGFTLMNQYGLYSEAASLFKKAVDLKPQLMLAWNGLQNCYRQLERTEDALTACDDALKINPFDTGTIRNKFWLLCSIGKFEVGLSFVVQKSQALFGGEEGSSQLVTNFKKEWEKQGLDLNVFNELLRHLLTSPSGH